MFTDWIFSGFSPRITVQPEFPMIDDTCLRELIFTPNRRRVTARQMLRSGLSERLKARVTELVPNGKLIRIIYNSDNEARVLVSIVA